MTAHLPPPLLALFAPRPPIPYLPPPEKRPCPSLSGIAAFVNQFQEELPDPEHGRDPFETKKTAKKEEAEGKDAKKSRADGRSRHKMGSYERHEGNF